MSLVWPAAEADIVSAQPRLHAVIIAVSDYPHLNGGSGALANDPLGLSQLTTPGFTGQAIARWLLNDYNNPQCPLGSIEVLLSPSAAVPTAAGPVNAMSATMAEVEAAVTRWQARCHTHRDNIAWFYFCGHGISKNAQYLLPQDFGNPALGNPFKNCIDFDGLRVGMRKCQAQTQLFFIDACRETPFGLLTQVNVSGDPIIGGAAFSDTVECSAAYYATTQTRLAYGPDNDVTYFGQALLWCLDGVGAIKRGIKWVVDTYSLGNALGQTMAQLGRRHRLPLACNPDPSGMKRIHEAPGPRVVAAIGCTSEAADSVANIRLTKDTIVLQSPPGQQKPLVERVDAGDWQIEITFPAGAFPASAPESHRLMPPVFEGLEIP